MSETWKTLPPYGEPAHDFERRVKGSCHCGKVTFWLQRDRPLISKYCHCNDCKKLHGAPFQWAAIFHKPDMAFETGVDDLRFYNSGLQEARYHLPCKVACKHCGALIMDEGRNMVLLFPTLLELPSEKLKEDFGVQCHIFYTRRVVDIKDGKPKWAGLDGKSQLLEDLE